VYSKYDHIIQNYDDGLNPFSNKLYTDGYNTPSEFTGNPHSLGDMIDGTWRPSCEYDMSCDYCINNPPCPEVPTVPDDFNGYI